MQPEEIQRLIEAGLPGSRAIVEGDGSHFQAVVVSDEFSGKSLVQKQKLVYATVNDKIASGELHALSIKTYTSDEWETAQ